MQFDFDALMRIWNLIVHLFSSHKFIENVHIFPLKIQFAIGQNQMAYFAMALRLFINKSTIWLKKIRPQSLKMKE